MLRLNLGCGDDIIPGYVNHDATRHSGGVDIVHDLRERPWPWPDDSAEVIRLVNVLEHLPEVVPTIDECWRILRLGGLLHIGVPHYLHENAWLDPTHQRPFHLDTFDYFDPDTQHGAKYGFYTPRKWRIGHKQLLAGDVVVFMHARKAADMNLTDWTPQTWGERIYKAAQEIASVVPPDATFILVDESEWDAGERFIGRRRLPFMERSGQYWGPPPDDQTAIHELDRLRDEGAGFIAFGWPAFWWLDHFVEFGARLRSTFRCLLTSDRLLIFDLGLGPARAQSGTAQALLDQARS